VHGTQGEEAIHKKGRRSGILQELDAEEIDDAGVVKGPGRERNVGASCVVPDKLHLGCGASGENELGLVDDEREVPAP